MGTENISHCGSKIYAGAGEYKYTQKTVTRTF